MFTAQRWYNQSGEWDTPASAYCGYAEW
jgi:hypothetical protein